MSWRPRVLYAGMIKEPLYRCSFAGDRRMASRGRGPRREDARVDELPRRRSAAWRVEARLGRHRHLSRLCLGLRELGVRDQPRRLLHRSPRIKLNEPRRECLLRFGGTSGVKYPDISNAIVEEKEDGRRLRCEGWHPAGRRSRLPHENGRQAEARGRPGAKAGTSHEVSPGMRDTPASAGELMESHSSLQGDARSHLAEPATEGHGTSPRRLPSRSARRQ